MVLTMLLRRIRILDLSRILAGPIATMILGDLGAEIIKVEPPDGDGSRQWAPFIDGESIYFMSINRNKKSIAIDLRKDEGKEIIYKLVTNCDVFIENFRPGIPEKLGIDYHTLKKYRDDLIYCSIKGYQIGSIYENKPAYDIVLQAISGLMLSTGEEGGPPIRIPFALVDIFAGLYAAISILAAIINRDKTGDGCYIEVPLYDSIIFAMCYIPMIYLLTGEEPKRMGSAHPSIVPYQAFKCKDGKYIVIAIGNDKQWESFCRVIGRADLLNDDRFRTNPNRVRNRDLLIPVIEDIIASKNRDEWVEILDKTDIPYGPVYSLSEVFEDEYVKTANIIYEVRHRKLGYIKQILYPALINGVKNIRISPPPSLGEDTIEVLERLGYSKNIIKSLIDRGIVQSGNY